MQFVIDRERCGEEACFTNSAAGRNVTVGFKGFASDGYYGSVINHQEVTPCVGAMCKHLEGCKCSH